MQSDVDLAPMTTYKLGGRAAWFAEPRTEDELREILEAAEDLELLVLGRGSNLVVSDHGFPGLVVRLGGEFTTAAMSGVSVDAGGAMPLPKLARLVVKEGRGGLEFFVGIPGSVGGAVRMNAGGHGSDTASWLERASVLNRRSREIALRGPSDLALSYRHSNLGDDDVVLSARFRTIDQARSIGEAKLLEITRWRKEHQPGGTLNAGSVFKNPDGDSAGRIIDSLGLKGYRRGGVAVSDVHANFFVSEPGATAQDVWELVRAIRRRVREETGVRLEPELRFVGAFDEEAGR
jgi:UDP-N-acetylmuramate dehydrogenase